MELSVVIPCYKSEQSIQFVIADLEMVLGEKDYEVILVNDCSPDHTWEKIVELSYHDRHVKAINLARNCGQHSAILTGLRYSLGEYVAVIDDDGQTPSDCIPEMLAKINEGWDVVCAKYEGRGRDSVFRDVGSYFAQKMSKWLLNEPKDVSVTVFFVAKRFVIEEIQKYDQPYPYLAGLLLRTTSRITNITVDQKQRLHGKSGYSFGKLLGLWLNGFTTFSIKPLQITSYIGVFAAFIGFCIAVFTISRKLLGYDVALGWSSVMTVMLVLGGCVLLEMGLLGEYIGRMYLSINLSPQSIIKETIGFEEKIL